jgi:hypothetical protein
MLYSNLQNGFGVPSVALVANRSEADLLGFAMESSPSAHSLARLMRWSMVLGLHRPNSSLKFHRTRPSRKASMALSGEMFSEVLRKLSHRDIYDLRLSPIF